MGIEGQVEQLRARLRQRTGCREEDIRIVYSPLRASPLGAHIDHQDGLVTGMTLDRAIILAYVPRSDRKVCVESLNFAHRTEFDMDAVPPVQAGDWGNYLRGAVLALQHKYELRVGIDGVLEGRMPIGGLSSSAAVGIAYLLALETANEMQVQPEENIEHDRYIENVYLGLKNGILDPSIILMSDRDHLTFLDCQSVEFKKIPTSASNGHFEVLVVYSGLAKSLVSTGYNTRVSECEQAARLLLEWTGQPVPDRPRLRMISEEVYDDLGGDLPEPLGRRARHFFTEMRRVREGVSAWQEGDLVHLGHLIQASGVSSIYAYESGCPHLITLHQILAECPGVYGARFAGGGFRGSCIGLADPAYRDEIVDHVQRRYPAAHPDVAETYSIHFCRLDGPARVWDGS